MTRSFLGPAFNGDIEMFELVVPELFEHGGEEGQGWMGHGYGIGDGIGIGIGRGDSCTGCGLEEGLEGAELARG